MTTDPQTTEPDNPAAYALARHIADHPVSTIQAAFRYLNAPLEIELHEDPASPAVRPELRDQIAEALAGVDGWEWADGFKEHSPAWQGYQHRADAVLSVLPATTNRAAVLREEAARIRAHCPDHLDSESAEGSWMACHCAVADDMERRMAVEAQQQTDAARPRCPLCQMPHDLTPGSMGARACESIRARITEAGRRHAGGDHGGCAAVDCETVRARRAEQPAVVAAVAGEEPAGGTREAEAQQGVARHCVEYFLQSRETGGAWEGSSSSMCDLAYAAGRLAKRRNLVPGFEYRIAQRTTTVNVQPLPDCLACRHWRCNGDGPCGALLDAWQRCTCTGPSAAVSQPGKEA